MLKVTYKGKDYHALENALLKAIIERTGNHFEDKLNPFINEIAQTDGHVLVDIPEDLINFTMHFHNVPEELKERITVALKG